MDRFDLQLSLPVSLSLFLALHGWLLTYLTDISDLSRPTVSDRGESAIGFLPESPSPTTPSSPEQLGNGA